MGLLGGNKPNGKIQAQHLHSTWHTFYIQSTVGVLGPVCVLDKADGHNEENKSYLGRLGESGTLLKTRAVSVLGDGGKEVYKNEGGILRKVQECGAAPIKWVEDCLDEEKRTGQGEESGAAPQMVRVKKRPWRTLTIQTQENDYVQ